MAVRAKFRCNKVERQPNGGTNIALEAVTNGSAENESFFKWTPGGQLTMHCVNDAASEQFSEGKEYYVDLTPAVKACLVAAGGSECDDEMERQCNATGGLPSNFIGSRVNRLRDALDELTAIVRGECPSLLNGDSGGNDRLAIEIDDLLERHDEAGDV